MTDPVQFADFEDSGSNGGGFPIWIVAVVIVVALLADADLAGIAADPSYG